MPAPIQPASVPDDKQKASPNNPPPKDTSQSKNHKQQSHSLLLSDEPPVILPCTVTSHASGNFFDLRPLTKAYPDHTVDYSVRGLDYPANFTINICAPLLLPVDFPDDPTSSLASSNVSALARYEDGSVRSLGQASTNPKFRGRNLILEYTNGSPCLNPDGSPTDLKSSVLISLKCAHDLDLASAKNQPALMSFVGSPDNCSFFFEARSIHACPAVNQSQSMAPVSIFLIIFLVALVVYIAGSMVLHPSMSWTRIKASLKSPSLLLKSSRSRPTPYSTHEYYKRSSGSGNTGLYRDDKDPISIIVPSAVHNGTGPGGQDMKQMDDRIV